MLILGWHKRLTKWQTLSWLGRMLYQYERVHWFASCLKPEYFMFWFSCCLHLVNLSLKDSPFYLSLNKLLLLQSRDYSSQCQTLFDINKISLWKELNNLSACSKTRFLFRFYSSMKGISVARRAKHLKKITIFSRANWCCIVHRKLEWLQVPWRHRMGDTNQGLNKIDSYTVGVIFWVKIVVNLIYGTFQQITCITSKEVNCRWPFWSVCFLFSRLGRQCTPFFEL